MQDEFSTGRAVIAVIEVLGYLVAVVGLLLGLWLVGDVDFVVAILAGGGVAFAGLVSVAVAQIARAQFATALNTARMADALERTSRGTSANPVPMPMPKNIPRMTPPAPGERTFYEFCKGHEIHKDAAGFRVGSQYFPDLPTARKHCAELAAK